MIVCGIVITLLAFVLVAQCCALRAERKLLDEVTAIAARLQELNNRIGR